jgi:hypothetical protein
MYALITAMPFCVPIDPGTVANYTRANPADLTPLTRMEQASIDTAFALQKHYFLLMQNIKQACFNALDASINNAFKVSNDPAKTVRKILDQLSSIYGQPTPPAMELNDVTFHSLYSAANAPKVLFCCIKDCAKIAILDQNPYMDPQLIDNAIRLLLPAGIYQHPRLGNPFRIRQNSAINLIPDLLNSGISIGILFFRS